jgi:uncharacterized membrane protein YfcA
MDLMDSGIIFNGLVIAVFAGVQSIFGMGVLVYGTPTFLLLGYGFPETLGILLPSSFAISLAQVALHRGPRPAISKALFAISVPMIGISLFVTISSDLARHAYVLIAVALLISAAARIFPAVRKLLRAFIVRNLKAYHFVMGVFHGVTNMGGALLAVMAATIHNDKVNARYVVAVYYMTFVVIQFLVLLFTIDGQYLLDGMIYMPVSLVVYFVFGTRLFRGIDNAVFQAGMTGFLVLYAAVLLAKWLRVY